MFLCIENGREFVTNASEADLKLCAMRNPGFTFRKIDYAPVESIRYHAPGPDPADVAKFPKRKKLEPALFSDLEIETALEDF